MISIRSGMFVEPTPAQRLVARALYYATAPLSWLLPLCLRHVHLRSLNARLRYSIAAYRWFQGERMEGRI